MTYEELEKKANFYAAVIVQLSQAATKMAAAYNDSSPPTVPQEILHDANKHNLEVFKNAQTN